MCRNIRPLFNYAPPSTPAEIEASALQFVRKVSGMTKPSVVNQAAFDAAVASITETTAELLLRLETNAPPKDRAVEAAKRKAINDKRFGRT
jgi:hypothetical protein